MACRDGSFSCGCEGVMLTIPFLAGVALKFESKIHPAFQEMRLALSSLTTAVQENVTGVRTVKSFAREPHEVEKFSLRNERYKNNQTFAATLWSLGFHINSYTQSKASGERGAGNSKSTARCEGQRSSDNAGPESGSRRCPVRSRHVCVKRELLNMFKQVSAQIIDDPLPNNIRIVLDHGEIKESGTHRELMERKGIYYG